MKAIKMQNLRAISDSGILDLNSINLFIGANSTGKSTILRFFPLLKQSIIKNSDVPILWYDSEGVDFGSFDESLNSEAKKEKKEEISFTFYFDEMNLNITKPTEFLKKCLAQKLRKMGGYNWPIYMFLNEDKEERIEECSVSLTISDDRVDNIQLEVHKNFKVNFDLDKGKICLNEKKIISNPNIGPIKKSSSIIPKVTLSEMDFRYRNSLESSISEKIIEMIFNDINPQISIENMYNVVNNLNFSLSKEELASFLLHSKTPKTIKKNIQNNLNSIFLYNSLLYSLAILEQLDEKIFSFFSDVSYIGPIRATAERYYRIQGLSVTDVDSMGNNVAMILYSMEKNERQRWNNWTKKNFNLSFSTTKSIGHTAIKVKNEDEKEYNLADTGFGYSQLLPVLLVIWKSIDKQKNKRYGRTISKTIVIEQPELHLHPAMQAQMADLLVSIIKLEEIDIRFIIETHSTVIVNRIGEYIDKYNYENIHKGLEDKVNIFLVNPLNDKEEKQKILKTKYTPEGTIENWPVGFLSGGMI